MLKSRSRHAPRRRPARAQLGIEALETRDLMSVAFSIVHGQLQVFGDERVNTINVDHVRSTGTTTLSGNITGGPASFPDIEIPNGILILPGASDTVNILGEGPSIVVDGQNQAGHFAVNVGKNGRLDNILGGTSIINDAQGLASLNVNDSADTTTRNVTLGLVNAAEGQIFGLGLPSIFYGNFGGTLTFSGGPGDGTVANTYTVQDTVALAKTILKTGTGNRGTLVNVQGTTGALTVNGQGSFQLVDVGLNDNPTGGGVQFIKGTVTAISTGGAVQLNVFDAAGPAAPNVTMGVNAQQLGFISGLAPATIFYAANDLETANVLGPQTATTYTITDTASNFNFPVRVATNVIGGNGPNTFNVQKTSGDLILFGGTGNDTFNVGSTAKTLSTIQGFVEVRGGGGTDTLNVNDQGTTTPQTYSLSNDDILPSDGKDISFFDIRNVNFTAGSGNNTIDVQQVLAKVLLNVFTGSGNNTFNVGNKGFTLNDILGGVFLHGGGGSNTLTVNDQAAAAAETYTIQPTSVLRLGSTGSPALINFDASFKTLTVNGTNTGFTNGVFNVVDTPKNGVTTLNTGSDNSTINVQGTSEPLVINAVGGNQHVNIGLNNSVKAINGAVTITNSIGETGLAVLDAAGPAAPNVTMGVDAQGFGFISGLAPAPIKYAQNDVSGVTVHGPQTPTTYTITNTAKSNKVSAGTLIVAGLNGGNTFNVQKTTGVLEIEDGAGKNTINIGSTANTLDTIQGVVSVLGALGGDTLNINDQGSTTPHSYFEGTFQGTTTLSRSGAAAISFTHITDVHLNKGPEIKAPQAKDLTLTKAIRAGQFATLSGRLVDADPAAKLELTVVWGDGSKPQSLKPGQEPFSLQHRYHKAGAYTVHVEWTDLGTGLSNSQDLTIQVKPFGGPGGPDEAASTGDLDAFFALLGAEGGHHGGT
jgi:hypothetical protein